MRTHPLATICILFLLAVITLAVVAQRVAPYDALRQNVASPLTSPDSTHWLGTDDLGRDSLSRLIVGARTSVEVGLLSVAVTVFLGSTVGIVSGYFGGTADFLIQRLVDGLMGIPGLILAMALIAALGNSIVNVMLAISLALSPGVSRIMRSALLAEKNALYIDAARVVGASHARTGVRHLLPALLPVIAIVTASLAGGAILIEASLSFLGLGTPPPAPSWGGMIGGEAIRYVRSAPWLSIAPGFCITALVLSLNLLGDTIRDEIDPVVRLRHSRTKASAQ